MKQPCTNRTCAGEAVSQLVAGTSRPWLACEEHRAAMATALSIGCAYPVITTDLHEPEPDGSGRAAYLQAREART